MLVCSSLFITMYMWLLLNLTSLHTDARSNKNETVLHSACAGGSQELVQYLVEDLKCDVGEFVGVYMTVGYLLLCMWGISL